MALNNRGLGRGLDALFDGGSQGAPEQSGPVTTVPLDVIDTNPNQPRKTFDPAKLEELSASIRQQGILQPLLVRPSREGGRYELIAGERRLRASRMAGLGEVPVVVRQLNDHDALVCTLMENLQRDDLNPIEEAKGLQALKDVLNCTVEDLAMRLGQGRSSIFHSLRLLKLDEELQEDIVAGRLSPSHAKAIASLEDSEKRLNLRKYIVDHDFTVRATEQAVTQFLGTGKFPWENQFTDALPEASREEGANTEEESRVESGVEALIATAGDQAEENAPGWEESPERAVDSGNGWETERKQSLSWFGPAAKMPEIAQLAKDIGAVLNCRAKITGTQEKGNISIAYDSTEQLNEILEKMGISLASLTVPSLGMD